MSPTAGVLDPVARAFYRDVMARLEAAGVPFLVGGAYAFERYTGIGRHTKDFDLFIHPRHVQPALDTPGRRRLRHRSVPSRTGWARLGAATRWST